MRKRTLFGLLALTLIPSAAEAAPGPVPPVVGKYVRAITGARALSVDVAQTGSRRTLHLVLARPNRVCMTASEGGRVTSAFVCDGRLIYEWDGRQYARRDAPKTLSGTDLLLPSLRDDVVFGLAGGAMLQPSALEGEGVSLRQTGVVSLHGVRCRPVSLRPANGDSGTIWFAEATGLPAQIRYIASGKTTTVTFSHYRIGQTVSDGTFAARPPGGLAAFAPAGGIPAPSAKAAPRAATPLLAVGAPAPDFTLPTADNDKPLSLSDFKGHPVLLDFWASWCPPCKKSLPNTQALASEFGRKGLAVLAVNSWDTKNGMATFLQAHPEYTMTVLFDAHPGTPGHRQGSLAHDLYHVSGIPTTYLIDKDGHVAAAFLGYEDSTDKRIRAALAKLGVQ